MCGVFSGAKCLSRMFIIPSVIGGGRPGGSPFSPGEEQTFSACALFPRKKAEPHGGTPASDLRGDREGPESGEER